MTRGQWRHVGTDPRVWPWGRDRRDPQTRCADSARHYGRRRHVSRRAGALGGGGVRSRPHGRVGWELCTLDKDDEEHCTIRTVKYGKLCAAVPRRFVRRKSMFLHCPRPLTLQQLVGSHLNTVHDLRVLHTMAVLARDLASDDPTSMSPSELFVFDTLKLDNWNRQTGRSTDGSCGNCGSSCGSNCVSDCISNCGSNRPASTGMDRQSASVGHLQKYLKDLEPEHWWLLAPLLRSRVLIDPDSFTADESGRAQRDLLEQSSWWISLLLRAMNAPALLILRKQDALLLAKRLLTLVSAPAGPHKLGEGEPPQNVNPTHHSTGWKRRGS